MELPSASRIVRVRVETVQERLHDVWDDIQTDPKKWLHYGLPGGGGFVMVSGFIAWLKRSRKGTPKRAT